jgi:uncharacterized Fe-S cluster-containing protein
LYSCEAYCEAHLHEKKIQKIKIFIKFTATCPKMQKVVLALCPLGVNGSNKRFEVNSLNLKLFIKDVQFPQNISK